MSRGIIQVMEDMFHGAYNPTPADPNDNQCIAIVLQKLAIAGLASRRRRR